MLSPAQIEQRMAAFRKRCTDLGLACTHQRQVIYRALAGSVAHPTPEAIYEQVKRDIPAISLATVYKNIRTFTDAGLLREVNVLHESVRLDANLEDHHHLVCMRCKQVSDVSGQDIGPVKIRGGRLPNGFRVERCTVELLGICADCARQQ